MENINQYLKTKNIMNKDIWAACKLNSGDIVIQTVNNDETKKLLEMTL